MSRTWPGTGLFLVVLAVGCSASGPAAGTRAEATERTAPGAEKGGVGVPDKVTKTDEEWRKSLTPEQYRVVREKGTEPAFTGIYWDHHEKGTYRCVACGHPLFDSDTKFDSRTGWPSFWAPLAETSVATEEDDSFLMRRTEVVCSRCGAHLGHVFEDGPKPTGLRYCINSAALDFSKEK